MSSTQLSACLQVFNSYINFIEVYCQYQRLDREEVRVLLFQLGSFYVEVFFTPDCEEVLDTRSFEDTEELQPYLVSINLDRPLFD